MNEVVQCSALNLVGSARLKRRLSRASTVLAAIAAAAQTPATIGATNRLANSARMRTRSGAVSMPLSREAAYSSSSSKSKEARVPEVEVSRCRASNTAFCALRLSSRAIRARTSESCIAGWTDITRNSTGYYRANMKRVRAACGKTLCAAWLRLDEIRGGGMWKSPRIRQLRGVSRGPMPDWASGRRLGAMRTARSSVFGRRPGALGTLLLFALLLAGVTYLVGPEPAFTDRGAPLVGWAGHVVDGDTLDIEGQRVRLVGLDAPELGQTCRDAAGGQWSCGVAAATRLRELVRGRELRCETRGHDRYGRLLVTCRNGAADVAASNGRGGARAGHRVSRGTAAGAGRATRPLAG